MSSSSRDRRVLRIEPTMNDVSIQFSRDRTRGRATLASLAILAISALVGQAILNRHHAKPPLARPAASPVARTVAPTAAAEVCGTENMICLSEAPSRSRLFPTAIRNNKIEAPAEDQLDPPPAAPIPTPKPPLTPSPPPAPTPDDIPDAVPASAPVQDTQPRRVKIRDESGRVVVARIYGKPGSQRVILPDGRLGWPRGLAFTDEPFVPDTAEMIADRLRTGPLANFSVEKSNHYVLLHQARPDFARASIDLLESLYLGLIAKLREKGIEVHDAEFPLVAIAFRNESDFRAFAPMPPEVQAYYNVVSNQIVFYETSERDETAPDVAARRRPQTVAHEGAHQVLQNIGVQPRLAHWPPWVVEGLAEYFAPTTITKDGRWDGANKINPFHMATIRDLQDPLALQLQNRGLAAPRIGRDPKQPLVEYLATRTDLTPTDYALAWALTHYLANKKFDLFLQYLRELSKFEPEDKCPTEAHLAHFRRVFGTDLNQLDRSLTKYLANLKHFETLPYYGVTFEQPMPNRIIRRGAMVSQSPAMIRQWVEEMTAREGGRPAWHAVPFPTRTRARLALEGWFNSQ